MSGILEYHDVWMDANAEFSEWVDQFEIAYGQDQADLITAMLLNSIPPGVRAVLSERMPGEMKNLVNKYEKGRR